VIIVTGGWPGRPVAGQPRCAIRNVIVLRVVEDTTALVEAQKGIRAVSAACHTSPKRHSFLREGAEGLGE